MRYNSLALNEGVDRSVAHLDSLVGAIVFELYRVGLTTVTFSEEDFSR